MKVNKVPTNTIQFFCLPYAGGSEFAFRPLAKYCPPSWNLSTLAYPGRGRRAEEPLVYTLEALVEDCWQQIKNQLQEPYVLFGHSLGARIAYLLALKIRATASPSPVHLILSGLAGPSVPMKASLRHLLPKTAFKSELKNYGGMPKAILNDEDAFSFFEPIIRADFQAIETWHYQAQPPLSMAATIITGTTDNMTEADIQLWQKEFSKPLNFERIAGNHFFLFEQPSTFINKVLQAVTRSLEFGVF